MFAHGGHAYVYLCYGIHHLFNVVTNREGKADAVLIRAVEPVDGFDVMMQRRRMKKIEKRLTGGPGVLTEALGIKTHHYAARLDEKLIWIEENEPLDTRQIVEATRIGVDYAGEDALRLWRFYIKENKWVSKY
jgi:DNA-3-methyladenine glycosylase